jgi:hypothetical protein
MADSWHYKLLGIEFGPVPFDALIQLAQSSSIGPTDEVREGEAGEWVSASSIVGLFSTPQSKPQEPSPAVADSSSEGSSAQPLMPVSTPSADGSMLFFWQSFGQEFGPVPQGEFRKMIEREQLSAGDQMRVETVDGWLECWSTCRQRFRRQELLIRRCQIRCPRQMATPHFTGKVSDRNSDRYCWKTSRR